MISADAKADVKQLEIKEMQKPETCRNFET